MTDIVTLKNVNADPCQEVVEELEAALELAKNGKLRAVFIVGHMTGHETYVSFSATNLQENIGAVAFLLHTLCARQRENRVDD